MSGSGPARVETPPCHPVIIRLSPVSLFDPPTRTPWRGSISPSISRVSRRYPIRAGFVLSTPRILLEGSVRNAHSNSKDPRSLLWSPTRADTGNVRTERERLSLLSGKTNKRTTPSNLLQPVRSSPFDGSPRWIVPTGRYLPIFPIHPWAADSSGRGVWITLPRREDPEDILPRYWTDSRCKIGGMIDRTRVAVLFGLLGLACGLRKFVLHVFFLFLK